MVVRLIQQTGTTPMFAISFLWNQKLAISRASFFVLWLSENRQEEANNFFRLIDPCFFQNNSMSISLLSYRFNTVQKQELLLKAGILIAFFNTFLGNRMMLYHVPKDDEHWIFF